MAIEIRAVRKPGQKRVHCLSCAQCCTYVSIGVNDPDTPALASELLWMAFHGIILTCDVDSSGWRALVTTRCSELQDDNGCRSYHARPIVCRLYDQRSCEVNDLGGQPELTMVNPLQLISVLRERRPRIYNQMLGKGYLSRELADAARRELQIVE